MILRKFKTAAVPVLATAAVVLLSSCQGGEKKSDKEVVDSGIIDSLQMQSDSTLQSASGSSEELLARMADAKTADVHTTQSGLQYVVIEEGTGATPAPTDEVSVHYTGKLVDGTVFDSSSLHGDEPVTFPLNRVIPGWTEGVGLMKEGGKYVFYIPSELAYGANGVPGTIPPDSPLIFEVELVKINKNQNR